MLIEILVALTAIVAVAALLVVLRQAATLQRLRLLAEQGLAGTRSEAETTRDSARRLAAISRSSAQF